MNLRYLLVSLFAEPTQNEPVRLQKQPTKEDYQKELNLWVQKNFYLIVLATFILIWICLTVIFFTVFNSTVETGNYYNLKGVI